MPDAAFPAGMLECCKEFLSQERTLDDLFASPLMFPLQRRGEMNAMHAEARRIAPAIVMEIGADKGGSVWAWCKALPTVHRVIACEIRGTPYSHLFEQAFPNIHFQWLPCGSQEAAKRVEPPIDVLFIDGDKSRFYEDFELYLPLMNPKGIVFFHDIQDPVGPREAFEKARRGRTWSVIIDKSDTEVALARERQGVPPAHAHEGWLRTWRGSSCGVGVILLGGKP